jgi:hypothetical protein
MRTLARSLLTVLILTMAAVTAGAGDSKEKLFIIINYSVYHCNAEIELNGVHITKTDKKTAYTVSGFSEAGMWIHPGVNTMTVTIKPLENKVDSSSKPTIEISLSTVKEGQMTNEGEKFMVLRIPEKEGDDLLANITKPVKKEMTFTPKYVPPSEVWTKAREVKLDMEARNQILKITKEYHAALKKKDPEALWLILQFASMDMMKLRHQPVDGLKEKFTKSFKEMMADRNFILLPLNPEKLVMKPVADGKMIYVTDRNGEEVIRTKEIKDSGSYTFPVYAGFIDGKWKIVR